MTTFLQASDRADFPKAMQATYVRVRIVPILGDVRLDQLNINDFNRLMLAMKADGRAAATRRYCYTTLRSRWTRRWSTGYRRPTRSGGCAKPQGHPRRPVPAPRRGHRS